MIKLIPTSSIQKAVKIGMTAAMIPQLKTGVDMLDCNSLYLFPYTGFLTPTLSDGTSVLIFFTKNFTATKSQNITNVNLRK